MKARLPHQTYERSSLHFGSAEVGEEVEDVLKVAEDRVVDWQLAIENFLKVSADVL